ERLDMARAGLVVASVGLGADGAITRGPDVVSRGIAPQADAERLARGAAAEAKAALAVMPVAARADREAVREELRRAVRRFYNRERGFKPVVLVIADS
ncbi:MAG TPA: MBL fold metallo-hydrolase, partial [bacterium]|nr:MBL fold metallo-hydrolase [bacterium]